ncbi:hypothetical protein [Streptomyces sp. NBC_01233]|uniref:hypothetical protein n=1 Tax=Streptomyces sp. NBC_01233 TaxID=2903787 RepID=UPI002E122567|nr:hypothetical protein OG332_04085 [Streptomyces sp. NBC_01233]
MSSKPARGTPAACVILGARPETRPETRPESRPDADDGLALNRALWDVCARIHGSTPTDRFYDVESFVAGRQPLYALERELAGDVTGKDLLHLQCRFGMDTLS